MKYTHLTGELDIDIGQLDEKTLRTGYKKKYIAQYLARWLHVNSGRREITDLNFIDCMCGAGINKAGDLSVSMEALALFAKAAAVHKDKRFNLFINDKDKIKTGICGRIAQKLLSDKKRSNINIFINNLDVNDYLQGLHLYRKYFNSGASVLLADPNDFGIVKVSRLSHFVTRYNCDAIINLFLGEYAPDGIDNRIRSCIGNAPVTNKDELIAHIAQSLKAGKIKYVFSYRFEAPGSDGLYQVIYATPQIKGIDAMKDALWETFDGDFYRRDFETEPKQLSMFAEDDEIEALLSVHARAAKRMLHEFFAGRTVDYGQIEMFLTENTMLKKADFLNCALRPLIEKRLVVKQGAGENKLTFKDDEYTFAGGAGAWAEAHAGVPIVAKMEAPGMT